MIEGDNNVHGLKMCPSNATFWAFANERAYILRHNQMSRNEAEMSPGLKDGAVPNNYIILNTTPSRIRYQMIETSRTLTGSEIWYLLHRQWSLKLA